MINYTTTTQKDHITDTFSPEKKGDLALLGSNAKSSDTFSAVSPATAGQTPKKIMQQNDTFEVIDKNTGEIKQLKNLKWKDKVFETEVLSADQMLIEKFSLQSAVRNLLPTSRTAKCVRLTTGGDVAVLKSIEHKKCHYSGLQTCGSVWSCPVCSAKVSSRRKDETIDAMRQHLDNEGQIFFLTLTFPHYKQDSLKELIVKQREALKFYRKTYAYKQFVKETGYKGSIRALEVTFGLGNGWHPHTHEILFCTNKVTFAAIKKRLFKAWYDSCVKAGLPKPSYRNGVDVQGGNKAGEYLNKYGCELALSHTKKARNDRFSPFDLLRAYKHDNDKQLGAKFVEFATAMKGARQLFWSPGLKDKFGINDMTDDELAALQEDKSDEQGRIELIQWRAVVRYGARATVLILSQSHSFETACRLIDGLFARYVSSGDMQVDDDKRRAYLVKQNEHKQTTGPDFFDKQVKAATDDHDLCVFIRDNAKLSISQNTQHHIDELRKSGVWQ